MAETKRMTAEQVVGYLLEGGGARFPARVAALGRAAVDGGGGVGADRRRARRAGAGGAADAPQRLPGADVVDACGRARAGDPEAAPRQLLPEVSGAAQSRASRRWSRSCRRRTSPASRRARSTRWSSRSGCGSRRARSRGSARASTSRSTRSATGRSRAATRICGWTRRWRRFATAAASCARPGARLRRARVRLPRGDRARRRREPRRKPSGAASSARSSSAA